MTRPPRENRPPLETEGEPTAKPLFVIGVNRSGTTLLSQMLDAHSALAIPYESHFFVPAYWAWADRDWVVAEDARSDLVRWILAQPYVAAWADRPEFEDVDLDRCTTLAATIDRVYAAYAARRGRSVWGDKTPAYAKHVDVLHRLFPNARYVHIVRDGRDVARSVLRQRWGANDLLTALADWSATIDGAQKALRMLPPGRFVEFRFEDLVADPEPHLRAVCALMELPFEPAMLRAHETTSTAGVRESRAGIHENLTRPPSADQCFKWRKEWTPVDQAIAHEIAGRTLARLGYPAGQTRHPLRVPAKALHRTREAFRWQTSRLGRKLGRGAARGGKGEAT